MAGNQNQSKYRANHKLKLTAILTQPWTDENTRIDLPVLKNPWGAKVKKIASFLWKRNAKAKPIPRLSTCTTIPQLSTYQYHTNRLDLIVKPMRSTLAFFSNFKGNTSQFFFELMRTPTKTKEIAWLFSTVIWKSLYLLFFLTNPVMSCKSRKWAPFIGIITALIIYMKKFLHSDWLRAVQFFFLNSAEKSARLIQCKKRKQTKHSDWSMIRETHRWPIKSFVFKSSARPGWCNWWRNFSLIAWYVCVPSAQPSEIFSCILLISNHMIFLVQFGINEHL